MMRDIRNEQTSDKLMGTAAVLSSIPKGVWYAVTFLVFTFIGVTMWFFRSSIQTIVTVIAYGVVVLVVTAIVTHYVRLIYGAIMGVKAMSLKNIEIRKAGWNALKAEASAKESVLKVDMGYQYLPQMIQQSVASGRNYKYLGFESQHHLSNLHMIQSGAQDENEPLQLPLPTQVRYEDIRHQIPQGHVLVGIGPNGVETKESAVGACVWIVGLSGTGKTSTTVLRVEERATTGHKFLAIDPHWFKPDSLTNAISGYAERFVHPPARDSKEALTVLNLFLAEFNGRKAGHIPQPWQPMTLLVDEVNALMDAQSDEEKEIKELLPTIARICGQEARNFMMGGIFISQQATLLAWLRKVALMIIVHQLLMESEKKLALNGDTDVIESMKTWPIGRTYVYGVGFNDGPRTVQQPYFAKEGKGQWTYIEVEEPGDSHEPLPFPVARKQNKKAEHVDLSEAIGYWNGTYEETGKVPTVKEIEARYQLTNHQARRLINEFILPEAVSE